MDTRPTCIALTSGEPAGIGPDLLVQLAQCPPEGLADSAIRIVAIADPDLLGERARQLGLPLRLRIHNDPGGAPARPGELYICPVALDVRVTPGAVSPRHAAYVLHTLDAAIDGCRAGRYDAMVTAPVHKGTINDAGIRFTGHTEYLAERTGGKLPVMMLACPGLKVALATTHIPLAEVCGQITAELLAQVIRIVAQDLALHFEIEAPVIGVCGLNPHAGEDGHLGREEIEIIAPTIRALQAQGYRLSGPLPADSAFAPGQRSLYDAIVAMYHDQGLAALKALGFGDAINVTLGLPIIRTSVDHGTALAVAGTGRAHSGSLRSALLAAVSMAGAARRRRAGA